MAVIASAAGNLQKSRAACVRSVSLIDSDLLLLVLSKVSRLFFLFFFFVILLNDVSFFVSFYVVLTVLRMEDGYSLCASLIRKELQCTFFRLTVL